MDQTNLNYREGCSMQRPPLLESDGFCYWKQRFETYICAKDIDLWEIIENGDHVPKQWSDDTKQFVILRKEMWNDENKKMVSKNFEAKLVLYNALPRKEYERVFMCKNAKEIWNTLIVTHQGNSQVIENKVELLVAQYEQFSMLENEKIDVGYSRFNNICTSLKALGTSYTNKQYTRKFLRALSYKWRPKVTAIEESRNLDELTLDELIGNLKVHEVILEKDEEVANSKKERVKSIALQAHDLPHVHRGESSHSTKDELDDALGEDDEQLAFMVRSFKRMFRRPGKFVRQPVDSKTTPYDPKKKPRRCFFCGATDHIISECPKRKEKAFIGGAWDDEEEEMDESKDEQEICLMASLDQSWSDEEDETCLVTNKEDEVSSNLDNVYSKISLEEFETFCDLSTKISAKNLSLKEEVKSLTLERDELQKYIKELVRENIGLKSKSQSCLTCDDLKQENLVLTQRLTSTQGKTNAYPEFAKSGEVLDEILKAQKDPKDKHGLGFTYGTNTTSTSMTKPIIFVKAKEEPKVTDRARSHHGPTVVRPSRPCPKSKSCFASDSTRVGLGSTSTVKPTVKSTFNNIRDQSSKRFGLGFVKKPNGPYNRKPIHHQTNFYQYHHRKNKVSSENTKSKRSVMRWVRVGIFDTNNPGPNKHWVPKV